MSKTYTQDELRRQLEGCIHAHLTPDSANGLRWAMDNLVNFVNSHTQQAVLEARIDENKGYRDWPGSLSDTGVRSIATERIAHLKDNQEKG